MNHSFEHPACDGFDDFEARLAAIGADQRAAVELTMVRENPAIDADGQILDRVMHEYRMRFDAVVAEAEAEIARRRAERKVEDACDTDGQDCAETSADDAAENASVRTTVEDVTALVKVALADTLPDFNAAVRARLADSANTAGKATVACNDAALRAYFALFGLPARGTEEIKLWYDGLSPKKQAFIDSVGANLVSSALWTGGAALVAWAVLG